MANRRKTELTADDHTIMRMIADGQRIDSIASHFGTTYAQQYARVNRLVSFIGGNTQAHAVAIYLTNHAKDAAP